MGRAAAVVFAILRELLAREVLPPARQAPEPPARRGLLRTLLSAEPLPPDLPPRRARPGEGPGRRDRLLGSDLLPFDPPTPRRRRGRWLAWLFAPDRLDP